MTFSRADHYASCCQDPAPGSKASCALDYDDHECGDYFDEHTVRCCAMRDGGCVAVRHGDDYDLQERHVGDAWDQEALGFEALSSWDAHVKLCERHEILTRQWECLYQRLAARLLPQKVLR